MTIEPPVKCDVCGKDSDSGIFLNHCHLECYIDDCVRIAIRKYLDKAFTKEAEEAFKAAERRKAEEENGE